MEIKKYFNYKDWWNWVFYFVLIFLIIFPLIQSIGTWQRWKWGYYSIDAIPPAICMLLLFMADTFVFRVRAAKEISEIRDKLKKKGICT